MTADPSSSTTSASKDPGLMPALSGVAIVAAVLALAAFAFFGAGIGAGVLLGGAIATANLWLLGRLVRAMLGQGGSTAVWAVVAVVKLLALVAGVWAILKSGALSPLSLVGGYTALPIGITLGSLFGPKPTEDPAQPPAP
jgi:hypothetical protein